MTNASELARAALDEACVAVGIDPRGAEPVRIAENQIWRVAGVIVRIAPPDRLATALREIRVARWLADNGIRAVRPLPVDQPLERAGHVVTLWEEVPAHTHGSIADVALALRELHALRPPDFDIGRLDPLVRIRDRLFAATSLSDDDRRWLLALHDELADGWASGSPPGLPESAVHGDAWPGNIVRVAGSHLMMDLERFSLGPPEWDLTSTAVRARTTGAVTEDEYARFCALYGHDVTGWPGYELCAHTRELRMVTYAAQHAASHPEWHGQAQYRVDCLRGRWGARPWKWTGIL
ncbi:Phosphotransferase enzyme family protein [Streptomyces sp. DvalAA-14]|uniref:aminoglycoside phosphotransferase family protein n=1 Tax=unclassified Streptomyces TaxID=2593676 RepID=UPI00081B981D|nr:MULTISPECIES: aminoglycoside phosphotransferase family protein [unclassified Streptomyces]MYS21259.1 phosphotransferase [Streptomyces sp. SID4948]SCD88288.1 Phosphotransferase enzyme family protein [Streptomyces sp. DvalAA-14]